MYNQRRTGISKKSTPEDHPHTEIHSNDKTLAQTFQNRKITDNWTDPGEETN